MTPSNADLPSIPLVDVRDGGPVRHARESALRAAALRDECLAWFPTLAVWLAPVATVVRVGSKERVSNAFDQV